MNKSQPRVSSEVSPANFSRATLPLLEACVLGRVFQQGSQKIVAIANTSCTIQPGQHIAITGPSGSGKSSLLHLFAGLDQPTSGSITWPALGNIQDLRPAQIGVALQTPGLLPPLSVVENVSIPLLLQEMDPSQARETARQVLERLELDTLAEQLPEELSGGQAQRVALARALVTQPRLILADEPTGQLDHPTAQRLFDLMYAAIDERETALVVATHDLSVAERCAHVWRIHQGVLDGTPGVLEGGLANG